MEKRINMGISQGYLRKISILILLVTFLAFGNVFARETAEEIMSRGIEYANKGNYDQAILDYSKAIELSPNYVPAYNSRGNAYQNKGNLDQAILDYSKAIELSPNYVPAYNSRGNAYQNKGNLDQAILDYSKAIELSPNYVPAYNSRGNAYYHKKEYDKTWADMHKIEELGGKPNPGFLEALKKASGERKINIYPAPK